MDSPHAGLYMDTVLAAAWVSDHGILPDMSFLLSCGGPALDEGEELDQYEEEDRKRLMATLCLQLVEAVYKEALLSDPAAGAERARAEATAAILSIGLSKVTN